MLRWGQIILALVALATLFGAKFTIYPPSAEGPDIVNTR